MHMFMFYKSKHCIDIRIPSCFGQNIQVLLLLLLLLLLLSLTGYHRVAEETEIEYSIFSLLK